MSNEILYFPCPSCGVQQEAESEWVGLKGECYECGHTFIIPDLRPVPVVKPGVSESDLEISPPSYRLKFHERIVDRIVKGRYAKARNSLDDRVREHIAVLAQNSENTKARLAREGAKWHQEARKIWEELKRNTVWNKLLAMPADRFLELEGVGEGTVEKMKRANLLSIAHVIAGRETLAQLPRVSVTARQAIESFCEQAQDRENASFYPVFSDKGSDSLEMKLLRSVLEYAQIETATNESAQCLRVLNEHKRCLPKYGWLSRLRDHRTGNLTAEQKWRYKDSMTQANRLESVSRISPVGKELSQDQYIRAIGLLDTIFPRPKASIRQNVLTSIAGDPELSRLPGFTKSERDRNLRAMDRRDQDVQRKYQEAITLDAYAGPLIQELLRHPQSEDLVNEIDRQALNIQSMRDIILRRYQVFAAKFILAQKRVVIGDEMGLGKTIQALAVMCHLSSIPREKQKPFRALVVCPASITTNWEREILRFTPFKPLMFRGFSRISLAREWREYGGVAVVSYQSLKGVVSDEVRLDFCVVDEAQYIKNPKANRTENARIMLMQSDYTCCMTGTPVENNLEEFLNLFEAAKNNFGSELRLHLSNSPDPSAFARKIQSIYLRRIKQDVLTELPPLNMSHEYVTLTQEELEAHLSDVESEDVYFMSIRQRLNDPDASGSSKIKRVLELISEYRSNRRNVMLFTYFREPMRMLEDRIPGALMIHGGIPPNARQDIIDTFSCPLRDNELGRVLCAQITSGGVGLNIQAASAVILLEPQFNPAVEVQAVSRVHRMGQRRTVDVHRMMCVGTIEEVLVERLCQKQEIMDLYAGDSHLKHLTPDAIDRSTVPLTEDESALLDAFRKRVAQKSLDRTG